MMEYPQGFDGNDDSILSGPGIGQGPKIAVRDLVYDMDGPQATSTVEPKASRMDVMQAYLKNLDSDELERQLLQKAKERKLPVAKNKPTERESFDPELSAISLINIDGMSGLSGSMLMDINNKASLGGILPDGIPQSLLSNEKYDIDGVIEKRSEQETEDMSYYDLSEGELDEDAHEPKGLGEQYLMNVSEKMRDNEVMDPSFELSNTQPSK
ncbi:unnamed protein product, partial [Meganyctiphanes norvegica]